jgi:hypothetical protein
MKKLLVAVVFAGLVSACGPEDVEAAPELESSGEALHLGTTIDQCSSVLKVLNADGVYQTIERGPWEYVDVSDRQFRWKCGSVLEQTTCDVGTNYVYVRHSTTSRQITWRCEA